MSDDRLKSISIWLEHLFSSNNFDIKPASSDASFRRYFRVYHNDKTFIVMDAPPEHENTDSFISVATFLFSHGINVPDIIAKETSQGFLLLSDFGSQPYLDQLSEHNCDQLYQQAISSLIDIQLIPSSKMALPHYDKLLLHTELSLFPDWFLAKHLDIVQPDCLNAVFELLIDNAIEQPQVIVHRDYHSRNLMDTALSSPGIIDFQDAVIGPISYDLVSLIRDCYISWPDEKLHQWIQLYLSQAQNRGLLNNISLEKFIRWFDLMGLQRHLKVLGIFCRLNYRDGKTHYMADLKQTLQYVLKVTHTYPELHDFNDFLKNQTKIMAIL